MDLPLTVDELRALLVRLAEYPKETGWTEFKQNYVDADDIGEYISALSNSAALANVAAGYLAWGIEDSTHRLVGTTFSPKKTKASGNEDLEPWLARLLEPRIPFQIYEFDRDGLAFVIFEIPAASHTPVLFKDTGYIRVGSYKKKLHQYREIERRLWALTTSSYPPSFEASTALGPVQAEEVLGLLDVSAYFNLTKQKFPNNNTKILRLLETERFIQTAGPGTYNITNMGAILLANEIGNFRALARKSVSVIAHEGTSKVTSHKDKTGRHGYANGFEGLFAYVMGLLPANELMGRALRQDTTMYPAVAVRELVANAIIHQDFQVSGLRGPTVDIFSDRIEVTNPGEPLIDPERFLDAPPQSRNDAMAAFMHKARICEERGCGIDRVFFAVEYFQLPPPDFVVAHGHTKVTLYAYRKFSQMSKEERVRACYQHAGLLAVSGQQMTNTTLRERLGISKSNYPLASKIIADALAAGRIRAFDPDSNSKKLARYVPIWA